MVSADTELFTYAVLNGSLGTAVASGLASILVMGTETGLGAPLAWGPDCPGLTGPPIHLAHPLSF